MPAASTLHAFTPFLLRVFFATLHPLLATPASMVFGPVHLAIHFPLPALLILAKVPLAFCLSQTLTPTVTVTLAGVHRGVRGGVRGGICGGVGGGVCGGDRGGDHARNARWLERRGLRR